jgi:hypothetical protein
VLWSGCPACPPVYVGRRRREMKPRTAYRVRSPRENKKDRHNVRPHNLAQREDFHYTGGPASGAICPVERLFFARGVLATGP